MSRRLWRCPCNTAEALSSEPAQALLLVPAEFCSEGPWGLEASSLLGVLRAHSTQAKVVPIVLPVPASGSPTVPL